ncbi:MAG: serine/threonine-protein phosphatase [Clostridia bacterium]|nr:serine/threonine-protein phosphatase [Clostridia bacterium]
MLKYASTTHEGSRTYNEDNLSISSASKYQCFVVCDGLGGHRFGDVASKTVADTFAEELSCCNDLDSYLLNSFVKAQNRVETKQKEMGAKREMKTTAVCMVANETSAVVGHVGDSRFYGFLKDGSYIRSLDHSIPQLLVQSNTITEEEIRNHPHRNMLLKVIGDKWDEPLCEISETFHINDFSAFLLCTDGFWEFINELEMIKTLAESNSPQEWLDKMVDIVNENGKTKDMDNFTAITIINQ